MAVTCKWNYLIGRCTTKWGDTKVPLYIYGNGNCPYVICTEDKQLFSFAVDWEHCQRILGLKKDNDGNKINCYKDTLFDIALNVCATETTKLAKYFVMADMEVTLYSNKEEIKK